MTEDANRVLTDLQARVAALEGWRAHQSDLLDGLINGRTTPGTLFDTTDGDPDDDTGGDGTAEGLFGPLEVTDLDGDALIAWVHQTVAAVIARPLRGEIKWCPRWWEHPEAVYRFTALHRAWTELASEPGTALSVYIRDHLDPCLRELTSPLGPFADCSHNERYKALTRHAPLPTLPTTPNTNAGVERTGAG